MGDVNDLRGHQVTVGELVFEFPMTCGKTDEAIIDHEALIEMISDEIFPHAQIVKLGKQVITALHEDVQYVMRQRRIAESTGVEQKEIVPEVTQPSAGERGALRSMGKALGKASKAK